MRIVSALSAVIVFAATYAMVLPAITMEKTAVCEIEEHVHSDAYYERMPVCGLEESSSGAVETADTEEGSFSSAEDPASEGGEDFETSEFSSNAAESAEAGNMDAAENSSDIEDASDSAEAEDTAKEAGTANIKDIAKADGTVNSSDTVNPSDTVNSSDAANSSDIVDLSGIANASDTVSADTSANADVSENVETSESEENVDASESVETSESEESEESEENAEDAVKEVYSGETESTGGTSETAGAAVEETSEESAAAYMPAMFFESTISVPAGKTAGSDETGADGSIPQSETGDAEVTVRIEADEGTFPEGTQMQLTAVQVTDAIAAAVESAVEEKTRGFHAVDISFFDSEGNKIEPLKPVRVFMTSDSIREAVEDSSTVPVVVHIEEAVKEAVGTEQGLGTDRAADTEQTGDAEQVVEAEQADAEQLPEADTDTVISEEAAADTLISEEAAADTLISEEAAADTLISEEAAADTLTSEKVDAEILFSEKAVADPLFSETDDDAVTDTLSFEADSFSVYAIVYTVDFEYDGKEFSIQGLDSILLSELLEQLEMPLSTEEIENVEFSDPALLKVELLQNTSENTSADRSDSASENTSENTSADGSDSASESTSADGSDSASEGTSSIDWRLVSLQAFASEETLTLTLKSGKVIEIRVTDAQYTDDLTNLFESLAILKNGEEMDITQPIIVRDTDSFELRLAFEEHDQYQFMNDDTPMYFDMPTEFVLPEDFETTTDVSITVGGIVHTLTDNKVTYDKDTHRLYLTWNTTNPEFAYLKQSGDARIEMSVNGSFDISQTTNVEFANSVTVEVSTPADAGVEKQGTYDARTQTISYEISVRAEGNVEKPIVLTDVLNGGALSYIQSASGNSGSGVTVEWGTDSVTTAHTDAQRSAISEEIVSSYTLAEDGRSFTVTIPEQTDDSGGTIPTLYDGEVVVIRYQAQVDMEKLNLSAVSAYDDDGNLIQQVFDDTGNTITLSNPGNKYDETSNNADTYVEPIQFSDMNKESELGTASNGTDSGGNDIRYQDITWTVTTNSTAEASLAGSTITDTMTWSPEYISMALQPLTGDDAGILVQVYDEGDPVEYDEEGKIKATELVREEIIPWTALHISRSYSTDADGEPLSSLTWTYDVPTTDESYKYVITYVTRANLEDMTAPSTVFNDVSGKGGHDDAEETIWPPGLGDNIDVEKTVTSSSLEEINWQIKVYARTNSYDDYFRVTDILPSQWIENPSTGKNELLKDSVDENDITEQLKKYLDIEGLQEGESWTAELVEGNSSTADKLLIRFWKETDDGEKTEGLYEYPSNGEYFTTVTITNSDETQEQKDRRLITITLKTDNNEEWIERATDNMSTKSWQSYHENKVYARGDVGDYDFASASAPIVKPSITKTLAADSSWAQSYRTVTRDGVEYPAYRFYVNVGGIRDDNDTIVTVDGDDPYIIIHDTFDTDLWTLYQSGDFPGTYTGWMDDAAYYSSKSGYPNTSDGAVLIGTNGESLNVDDDSGTYTSTYTCTATEYGMDLKITNPPKKADGSYRDFYTFLYWLVPKDEEAMEALIKETLKEENKQVLAHVTKGVASFTNTAEFVGMEDEADYEYEYNPTSKEVSYDESSKTAAYTVVLNEQRAKLLTDEQIAGGQQKLEMTDVHSDNLSVDFSSIRIYINDETEPDTQQRVTYDYSGTTGTFSIPDETKVTITYDAKVIATPGTTVTFENTVTMAGYSTEITETRKVASDSSSSAGVYQLNLFKYASGHMESGLSGAQFRLLDADKKPILDRDGNEIIFETGGDGYTTVTLDESTQGVSIKKNTTYYLQEVLAPIETKDSGETVYYRQDPVYYSFLISDNPDYSAPGGVYVYSNGDILKVRNFEDTGGINIRKSFAGNVELTDEQKAAITFRIERKSGSGWSLVKEVPYSDFTYSDYVDENGISITGTYHYAVDDLTPGTYRVVERNAQPDDEDVNLVTEYLVDGSVSDTRQFTVTEEDITDLISHNTVITNTYFENKYTFTKLDSESGADLAGAVFAVYKKESGIAGAITGDTLIRTYTTGEDGTFVISKSDTAETADSDSGSGSSGNDDNSSGSGSGDDSDDDSSDSGSGGDSSSTDPVYEEGSLYYAVETAAPEGYSLPETPEKYYFYFTSADIPDGITAVDLDSSYGTADVTNAKEKVSVPVRKTWGQGGQMDWPAEVRYVKIGLYRKEKGSDDEPEAVLEDEEAITVTLTADAPFDDTTFADLPAAAADGKPLIYSVQEIAVSFDGTTDEDPEDSYNISYTVPDDSDGEQVFFTVNNIEKGAQITVSKEWYGKEDGSDSVKIEDPQGEKYQRTFSLYRTTEQAEVTLGGKVTLQNKSTGTLNLIMNDDQYYVGDLLQVEFAAGNSWNTLDFNYDTANDTTWKRLYYQEGLARNTNHVIQVQIPDDALNIYFKAYSGVSTPQDITVTRVSGSSMTAGLLSADENGKAVTETEYVTDITLPTADRSWSYTFENLDKYDVDDDYKTYTYWVQEDNETPRTVYRYKNDEVIVSNYEDTTSVNVSKEWTNVDDPPSGVLFDLYRTTDAGLISGTQQSREGETRVAFDYRYEQPAGDSSTWPQTINCKVGDKISIYFELPYDYESETYVFNVDLRKILNGKEITDPKVAKLWQKNGKTSAKLEFTVTQNSISDADGNILDDVTWRFRMFNGANEKIVITKVINETAPGLLVTSETLESAKSSSGAELVEEGIELNSSDSWTYTNDLLEKYDENGNEYYYFAVERALPGYTTTYDVKGNDYIIRNTKADTSEESGALTVTKIAENLPSTQQNKSFYFTLSKDGYYYNNNGTAASVPDFSTDASAYIHQLEKTDTGYSTITFNGLPAGAYTITEILKGEEQGAEIPNYSLETEILVDDTVSADGSVTVEGGAALSATIKNTYKKGVEQTQIKAKKQWMDEDGNALEPGEVPADSSVTFVLKRYMSDGVTEDQIFWDEGRCTAVLDGEADACEQEAWVYTWPEVDKVYWDYDLREYVEYVYEVAETSVTYGGVTTVLAEDGGETWESEVTQAEDGWVVTNIPNLRTVTLDKVWLDPDGSDMTWPEDADGAYVPIGVTLTKTLNIPGIGKKESKDTLQLSLVPDNDLLEEVNSGSGLTITCSETDGRYVFTIIGLKDRGEIMIGGNLLEGTWEYSFTETVPDGFETGYGAAAAQTADGEMTCAAESGTILNSQQPVTQVLSVTKEVTLADGTTLYTGDWPAEGFTFTLAKKEGQPEGAVLSSETSENEKTVSSDSPTAEFGAVTFTKAGTYTFLITEKISDNSASDTENFTYDTTSHTATVTVTGVGGELEIASVVYDAANDTDATSSSGQASGTGSSGQASGTGSSGQSNSSADSGSDTLTIANTYNAPGEVLFKVKKIFAGGQFSDSTPFTFTLTQVTGENSSTAVDDPLVTPQTITTAGLSGSSAVLSFEPVSLTAGTYYFLIEENVPAAEDRGDIQYDSSASRWITVEVSSEGGTTVIKKNDTVYDMAAAGIDAEFTNSLVTSQTAVKKWLESDGATVLTPEDGTEITLLLTRWKKDGTMDDTFQVQSVTLDGTEDADAATLKVSDEEGAQDSVYTGKEGENWTYTWNDLPTVYPDPDNAGAYLEYEYQVVEKSVKYGNDGTAQEVTDGLTADGSFLSDVDGMNITNRVIDRAPTCEYSFTKVWRGQTGEDAAWPDGLSFTAAFYVNDTATDTALGSFTFTADGASGTITGLPGETAARTAAWTAKQDEKTTTFTLTDLPASDDSGHDLTYYVKETACAGYTASYAFTGEETATDPVSGQITTTTTLYTKTGSENNDRANNGEYIINIPEDAYELPSTGGPGSAPIYLTGLLLTALAGAALRHLFIHK